MFHVRTIKGANKLFCIIVLRCAKMFSGLGLGVGLRFSSLGAGLGGGIDVHFKTFI